MRAITTFDENDVAVIGPAYHIRPNGNRCIIYPYDPEAYATWRLVSGMEGIALTLLDGQRTMRQSVEAFAYLFDVPTDAGEDVYRHLIERSCEQPGGEFLSAYDGGAFHSYATEQFVERMWGDAPRQRLIKNKLDVPLSLLFMPSNACQVDCVYCYSERRQVAARDRLPVERWLELIDEAADMGVDLITVSGGDPMTYRGIERLFRRMSERHIKFLFSTKTFVSKLRARRLVETGMRDYATVQVSIDGVSAATVEKMMRVANYHERAFRSIENLVEAGFSLRTNTVCTPLNIHEVPQLVRRLHALGVQRAGVTNYGRSHFRHDDALFLSEDQIEWVKAEVARLRNELNWEGLSCNAGYRDFTRVSDAEKKAAWSRRSDCSGGSSSLTITPNGDIVLCEQVPQEAPFVVGNVRHSSIGEVWESPQIEAFVSPPRALFESTPCRDCEEFDTCHQLHGRCFRDALFTYGTPYAPSPNCPRATGTKRMA